MNRLLTISVLLLFALTVAQAAVVVSDFETDADVAAWRLRTPSTDKLVRASEYATSAASSLKFTTPAWREGMEQWPAFDARPTVSDWHPFDRLVLDIVNPDPERHFFAVFISDSKVPFREGLSFTFELPTCGHRRFFIPLSRFPESVNRGDISIIHFFTQRPAADMTLYLDNLVLLKPGETIAEPVSGFVRQVARLSLAGLESVGTTIEQCRQSLYTLADTPALKHRADDEIGKVVARLQALRAQLDSPTLALAQLADMQAEMARITKLPDRIVSAFKFEKEFDKLGFGNTPMIVGFATSMEKILPRDVPFELTVSKEIGLSLARNEKEAFQIAVLPRSDGLRRVAVRVSDLKSASGEVLKADNIDCDVVGYVETKTRPPYNVSYVGWWPDPILDFLGRVDIAPGDLQTFWVRVRAPKDQAPGVYHGQLRVSAADARPLIFGVTVRVYSFALPDHTPLPTAITFFEHPDQMGGKENWPQMKLRYADFLADYYIDYDSLYRSGPPDFEILKHLHDRGRLVAFNIGNVFNAGTSEEGFDKAIAETIERLRPGYEQAKELGILDHAYIYGFDERPKEQFPLLEKSAQALRKAFPEVLLMTTSYDQSYGLDSVVKTIDAWCPLTPSFSPEKARLARAAGKKVWWYICCGPHNPYANWFVEYAAIEARLLMGAMTTKYRPDGFLYYSLTIWNDNKPIETGPFTEWNPVSWTTYHGDGSLLCSGDGGKPVPTLRLENYRDGMEDFAYACILEEIVRQYEARRATLSSAQKKWLAEARLAPTVPDSLVETMAKYSRDPAELYKYRNHLGDLIDRSGLPDANPWGDNFGVRGFPNR